MGTVLTIDFDIIMGPDISVYNGLITTAEYFHFENLVAKYPLLDKVEANMETYYKITSYLLYLRKILKREQFAFIESHDMILEHIEGKENTVINIDHHHDLGYGQNFGLIDVDNCANWAFMGLKSRMINKYIWIKNRTSDEATIHTKKLNQCFAIDFSNFIDDINLKNLPVPDKVVICLSSPWVPKKFRPLFKVWDEIVNS